MLENHEYSIETMNKNSNNNNIKIEELDEFDLKVLYSTEFERNLAKEKIIKKIQEIKDKNIFHNTSFDNTTNNKKNDFIYKNKINNTKKK